MQQKHAEIYMMTKIIKQKQITASMYYFIKEQILNQYMSELNRNKELIDRTRSVLNNNLVKSQ